MRWGRRRSGMHSVFFGLKRAHFSIVRFFAREVLTKLALTPGRYDLMLYLKKHEDEDLTQRDLRKAFGVARSTMSEALRSMVELRLINRHPAEDGRTFWVKLTKPGEAALENAFYMTKRLVKMALKRIFRTGDVMEMHNAMGEYMTIRWEFGDTAVPELKPLWHPDD